MGCPPLDLGFRNKLDLKHQPSFAYAEMQVADMGTKSQPTLNALWQKPGPQIPQRVRQPLGYPMRPPQNLPQPPLPKQTDSSPSQSPAGTGRRLPPSWDNSQSARAAGWIKAATPSPVAPLPGLQLVIVRFTFSKTSESLSLVCRIL